MLKRFLLPLVSLILVLVWTRKSDERMGEAKEAFTLALLDTGLDREQESSPRLLESFKNGEARKNFFAHDSDTHDLDGHGTKLFRIVTEQSPDEVKILPVKLVDHGPGLKPDELADALLFAAQNGARLINVSLGLSDSSPRLESAVRELNERGVLIVAAAGIGLTNSFRPEPLSRVYPQALPGVVVVSSTRTPDDVDPQSNFGPELSLTVLAPFNGHYLENVPSYGSSFAAAWVSARLATLYAHDPKPWPQILEKVYNELRPGPQRFGRGLFVAHQGRGTP